MKVKVVVDDSKYKNITNTKFAQVSKTKLKWKTIKWLIENKKENLDKLSNNRQILEKFNQIKEDSQKGLNKKEFGDLMISNGITKDRDIINKLFWVFDEDGSGDIEYKELAFGLEMFRESSLESKLKSKLFN
jgi:Ca2+-binding EF-hand superfamily protein